MSEHSDGRQAPRFYLTLDAAARAVERAAHRGQLATVVVCQLRPLDGIEVGA